MLRFQPIVAACLLWSICMSEASRAEVILFDPMDSSNYSIFLLNSNSGPNPDDNSTGGFVFFAAGGNPGARLELSHEHDVLRDNNNAPQNGNGQTFLQSFLTRDGFTYNPSVSGAIADISFSIDVNFPVSGGSTAFQDVFFVVADQGGGSAAGFTNISGQNGWQTLSVTGLTNAAFSGRNFAGNSALSFGFGFISAGDVTLGAESLLIGLDNFQVSITAVPEPGSFVLVGAALAIAASRRRTRWLSLPSRPSTPTGH